MGLEPLHFAGGPKHSAGVGDGQGLPCAVAFETTIFEVTSKEILSDPRDGPS
jgi:hypothetical protein